MAPWWKTHEPGSVPRQSAAESARKSTRRQHFGHSPLPAGLGLIPHIFSPFTHPTDTSAQRSEVAKQLPMQEQSLTGHLRCEWTSLDVLRAWWAQQVTAGRASARLTAPLQLLGHTLGCGHRHEQVHLQSKWHLLPQVYPLGSNCGATNMP